MQITVWKWDDNLKLRNESKTLFIPLLGKALMSKDKLFLYDPKAEEIISTIDYNFDSIKQSKWFDIDYEEVIKIRKEFYDEDNKYKMIDSSVTDYKWLEQIANFNNILIVAEGLTMYLSEDEIKVLIEQIKNKFGNITLLFDAYSKKGVKASRIKNPVNQMNAAVKYGIDKPEDFLKLNQDLEYINTYKIRKEDNNLQGLTKFIFNNLYCGRISQLIYKIYEFNLKGKIKHNKN